MDHFPEVKTGDWVQATKHVHAGAGFQLVAKKGDLGRVIGRFAGELPTILWERTGLTADCIPHEEFDILCERDFASDAKRTPRKPRTEMLRRAPMSAGR